MSSGGMLIATDQILSPGWYIEVEVDGPFHVDDRVSRKQIVKGRVVRSESGKVTLAALRITSHSFQAATGSATNIDPLR